jgi:hypothetical protein
VQQRSRPNQTRPDHRAAFWRKQLPCAPRRPESALAPSRLSASTPFGPCDGGRDA